MQLNLDHYRLVQEGVLAVAETVMQGGGTLPEAASSAAVARDCPIVAVYCFLGEKLGFTPEISATVERLKAFYKITEVVGIRAPKEGKDG